MTLLMVFLCLTVVLNFLVLWLILESLSILLLVMVSIVCVMGFVMSLITGVWDLSFIMLILSMVGGFFVLIGMVILSFPKDYDVVVSLPYKGSVLFMMMCLVISLMWFLVILVIENEGFFFPYEGGVPFLFSWPYYMSFIFSIFLLFVMLFLVDFFISGGMEGTFFKSSDSGNFF